MGHPELLGNQLPIEHWSQSVKMHSGLSQNHRHNDCHSQGLHQTVQSKGHLSEAPGAVDFCATCHM
jgi:hypothetical protein